MGAPAITVLLSLMSGDGDSAFLGELVGVAREVEQELSQPGLVGMDGAEVRWAIDDEAVAVFRADLYRSSARIGNFRQRRHSARARGGLALYGLSVADCGIRRRSAAMTTDGLPRGAC